MPFADYFVKSVAKIKNERGCLSRRYFTVIGNMCKLVTVVINVLVFDKHASASGLASLFVCLLAAYLYEQARSFLCAWFMHCRSMCSSSLCNATDPYQSGAIEARGRHKGTRERASDVRHGCYWIIACGGVACGIGSTCLPSTCTRMRVLIITSID